MSAPACHRAWITSTSPCSTAMWSGVIPACEQEARTRRFENTSKQQCSCCLYRILEIHIGFRVNKQLHPMKLCLSLETVSCFGIGSLYRTIPPLSRESSSRASQHALDDVLSNSILGLTAVHLDGIARVFMFLSFSCRGNRTRPNCSSTARLHKNLERPCGGGLEEQCDGKARKDHGAPTAVDGNGDARFTEFIFVSRD